jgi:hypothetical protein
MLICNCVRPKEGQRQGLVNSEAAYKINPETVLKWYCDQVLKKTLVIAVYYCPIKNDAWHLSTSNSLINLFTYLIARESVRWHRQYPHVRYYDVLRSGTHFQLAAAKHAI